MEWQVRRRVVRSCPTAAFGFFEVVVSRQQGASGCVVEGRHISAMDAHRS